jgi:hypothetical protein
MAESPGHGGQGSIKDLARQVQRVQTIEKGLFGRGPSRFAGYLSMEIGSEVVERLKALMDEHEAEPWNAYDGMPLDVVWETLPGRLVAGVRDGVSSPIEALALLALAVAKRALPCWELYCDGDEPARAVAATEHVIRGVADALDVAFERPARPSFCGIPIVDCRSCDTEAAADSVAYLVRFVRGHEPLDAVFCLSAADLAFDQSPLGRRDDFRQWLRDVALPAALERRLLLPEEEAVLRDYTVQDIRNARAKQ